MAAYIFIDTLTWPGSDKAAAARKTALEAWKTAAEFHPLVVLNGSPDGSVFGNHAASMGFLVGQAQKATGTYLVSSRRPSRLRRWPRRAGHRAEIASAGTVHRVEVAAARQALALTPLAA